MVLAPSACRLVGLGRGLHPGAVPPQQVLGVPQGVYGRIVGWLVKGGVVFDATEVAHALCNFSNYILISVQSCTILVVQIFST